MSHKIKPKNEHMSHKIKPKSKYTLCRKKPPNVLMTRTLHVSALLRHLQGASSNYTEKCTKIQPCVYQLLEILTFLTFIVIISGYL
jgi:hypothetical protein